MDNVCPKPGQPEWLACERLIKRFEAALRAAASAPIEEYLPADGAARQAVLRELVHTELEHRLKKGEAARVEEYLRRYPELAQDDAATLEDAAAANERLPGEVFLARDEGGPGRLACACGQGALALDMIQLEGKRALPAPEFLRGHNSIIGARLGS